MGRMKCSAFIISLIVGLQMPAGAAPLRLTIDEAVTRAAAANLDVSANRKDIDIANANLRRNSAWLPSNPFLTMGTQHVAQNGIEAGYYAYLSQEFELGGQRRRRKGVAELNLEKETWNVKSAELNLAASVKTAFIQALISMDRVTLAHQGVDFAADLANRLEADHPTATGTDRIELNAARIQEARARRELADAEQTRENALDALRRLIELPLDQEIELAGAPQTVPRELPAIADLVAKALQQRPDLVALHHASAGAQAQVALTERERIPNVTLAGSISTVGNETRAGGDIAFPLPIFQTKTGDIQEAIAERDRNELQIKNLEREIEKQTREARRACVDAADDLTVIRQTIVPLSEENEQIERRLFVRDKVSATDLIGQQIDLLAARREHLDAVETFNTSLIELERVVAGPFEAP